MKPGLSGQTLLLAAAIPATAWAQASLIDDFEPAGPNGAIWHQWPEPSADEPLWSSEAHNHTPEGAFAAMAVEADPYGYASYADFGITAGPVYAEVWVYDPLDDSGTDVDRPVSCMLALIGTAENPAEYTDYLQLGVVAWYTQGLTRTYSIRAKYRDAHGGGFVDTGVPRKLGWTKMAIAADGLADGGQARFYIDDQLVGVSRRSGVDLQYIRLGVNFKSYDFFWYDDVLVNATLPPDAVRFDIDGDGDVDNTDFGVFQACWLGTDSGATPGPGCWCMDADEDGRMNGTDLEAFVRCVSGPAVPADAACDN